MSKFAVGEVAITIGGEQYGDEWPLASGDEVEITEINPCPDLIDTPHYGIDLPTGDGRHWAIGEDLLRKRRPPEEAADESFQKALQDKDLSRWLTHEVMA